MNFERKKNWKRKGFDENGNIIYEIIYSNDGIAKEYDFDGKLEFEGEYLNGLRNGKGKSYEDNGRLEFEGEYLNGKKWNGKEKEYDYNGKLVFDGEYLNGEKIFK